MRASRQPSVARSASSASPISGAIASAGASRSLRQPASHVGDLGRRPSRAADRRAEDCRGGRAPRRPRPSRPRAPARPAPAAAPANLRAAQSPRRSRAARSARPARHIGTSAPSFRPIARSSSAGSSRLEKLDRGRAAPPPRRPSRRRGRPRPGCSSRRGSPRAGGRPVCSKNAAAARQARSLASPGACAAKRPVTREAQRVGRRRSRRGRRRRRRPRCCRGDDSRRRAGRSRAARD